MARLTDEELRMLADSQPRGPSWIRDVLLELLEHRARIAAHATAHPERLSDEVVAKIRRDLDNPDTYTRREMLRSEQIIAIAEIQQRRAADLTPDDLETVREMLAEFAANDYGWENGTEDVVDVCRKLLRSHGASS